MDALGWTDVILRSTTPTEAWQAIFQQLNDIAAHATSPKEVHNQTVAPDRLLAESGWELWEAYSVSAERTAARLKRWYAQPAASGRATLILDALSLRELRVLLEGAAAHGIKPSEVTVTGSEVPSDTNRFAQALGVPTRSSLANNGKPGGFVLAQTYTDVLSVPFQDCLGSVPYENNIFLWHTFIDDLIHQQKSPEQVYKQASDMLKDAGFWALVDRMRQGRELVITGDHGYATSKLFSDEITDKESIQVMRETFSASRTKPASTPWENRFMPPLVLTENKQHVVIGQRKWSVQGSFPDLCHGGLSLLEIAAPYIKLPAK